MAARGPLGLAALLAVVAVQVPRDVNKAPDATPDRRKAHLIVAEGVADVEAGPPDGDPRAGGP